MFNVFLRKFNFYSSSNYSDYQTVEIYARMINRKYAEYKHKFWKVAQRLSNNLFDENMQESSHDTTSMLTYMENI